VLAAGLLTGGIVVPLAGLAVARAAVRRTAPARGQLSSAVTDLLAGAADLHAFGACEIGLRRAQDASGELTAMSRRSATASGLGVAMAALVAGITVWAVLLIGVAAVGSGTLTRVPLAVVVLTALAAFEAVTTLPAAAVQLGHARVAATRIAEVVDSPDPVTGPARPRPLPPRRCQTGGSSAAGLTASADDPFTVRLVDAAVRYRPGGPLAIDGVTLELPPGRRIALVGRTGAGKSTVAAVLLRFRDLSGGSATLGGHELASYDADDVRKVIGGYPQDPHLFDTTIGENLRIARPAASDDELAAVAARVGLADWIAALPMGWDTPVGPLGRAVSGGQRQRIALARALLADPAVLILDEPTAHLDVESRQVMTADLLAATAGRATLLITHDLSGLDQVDEVIVLERGIVAERGTHQQLLSAGRGYWQMWQAQAGTT
jgi:ATP-binding cassette, subfamily C, bacterial CydC